MIDSIARRMFEELADSLEVFGANYGLRLEKYYHGMPAWRFSFQHPSGGTGCVELTIESPDSGEVALYWWKDHFEEGRRRSRRAFCGPIRLEEAVTELERNFLVMLNWETKSLTEITEGFKEAWHERYTKDQFDSFTSKLPKPSGYE